MAETLGLEMVGKRVGNYVVECSLAQGGMGTVFVARHPALGRKAAVKFLGRENDVPADHSKRFLDEACITASLHHPNIVDIFDFGELDGRLYYVMELLEGRDLSAVIRSQHRFSIDEIQIYLEQICSGLEAAHRVGVVHRDLKPSNIFVLAGQPPRLKLMDFGVAKVMSAVMSAGSERTRQGQIIGTPRYMSPEQALGQIDQITPRSDLYSLGVILYEMITGTAVFEHDSPMMLLVMHVRDEVRPIRSCNPDVPPAVATLIETCLSKNPSARPQSAREMAERFAEAVRTNSVLFERPSGLAGRAKPSEPMVSVPPTVPAGPGDPDEGFPQTFPAERVPIVSIEPAAEKTPDSPNSFSDPVTDDVASASSRPCIEPADISEMQASSPDLLQPDQPPTDALQVSGTAPTTQRLTKADRATLNKLWLRMQRGGDFPAFVRNVGEVSKRADFESAFSATQLGDSILKDFALTAKLLRVVNSAYANRFGGKIYSVQHAIVILGFDRVRSLALSISLFKKRGTEEQAQRVSESAINSLVSGELTQQLAPYARVFDEEQAMMCGMFRNLGRHLAIVYLPDLYEQMVALVRSQEISLHAAAERVLGLSLQKLGIGIAERWRLPKPIIRTMSAVPGLTGQFAREEDRLVELAEFSNEVCDIVANAPEQQRSTAISTLLVRHKSLLTIDQDKLAQLLQSVQQSFEQRYASLLGLEAKTSRFCRNMSTMVSQPEVAVKEAPAKEGSALQARDVPALSVQEPEMAAVASVQMPGAIRVRAARPRPQAQRIQLAKINVTSAVTGTSVPGEPAETMSLANDSGMRRIDELRSVLERDGRSEKLFTRILSLFAEIVGLPALLVLKATSDRSELVIASGVRDDVESLMKEFRVPLVPARLQGDVFSQAYHRMRDVVIEDAFAARATASVPQRYYETIGSPSFALYSCTCKGVAHALVLVECESPRQLPSPERLARVAELRPLVARAMG